VQSPSDPVDTWRLALLEEVADAARDLPAETQTARLQGALRALYSVPLEPMSAPADEVAAPSREARRLRRRPR
jgi:hypothetical protein